MLFQFGMLDVAVLYEERLRVFLRGTLQGSGLGFTVLGFRVLSLGF